MKTIIHKVVLLMLGREFTSENDAFRKVTEKLNLCSIAVLK